MALSLVAGGQSRTSVARKLGRNRNAVTTWIRRFNDSGVEGLVSGWKGNPGRILSQQELEILDKAVSPHPREARFKTGRWTAPLVLAFALQVFGKKTAGETARQYLHLLDYRHKVPAKRFIKADPQKQREFAQDLEAVERQRSANSVTAYVDQGQIWQEALPRKGWFRKGVPAEVDSSSPGKKDTVLYSGNQAQRQGGDHAGQAFRPEYHGQVPEETQAQSAELPD